MQVEIVTKEDLEAFRVRLLQDLRQVVGSTAFPKEKEWLKNSDVKKLLNVSSNTVQRLRIGGQLKSSKVGGVHYYRYEDIQQLLNKNVKR